jgi:hypothetical protein
MQTFTRVYDTYSQAERAIADLETAGVPAADMSLVANKYVSEKYDNVDEVSGAATGAGVGAAVGGGAGLLAGLGLLAIPGVGPVVAVGWLASTAVGALAGSAAGGLIGALADSGTPERDAHVYSEAVRRGGTLLTVRTEVPAVTIDAALNKYRPIDPSKRRGEYEAAGWKNYDPKAAPYKPSQAEIERIRRNYEA